MKNLVDFDISEVFSGKSFSGIGSIERITSRGDTLEYFTNGGHSVTVKSIPGLGLKITLNPDKKKGEFEVPHSDPSSGAATAEFKSDMPSEGEKFQITVKKDSEVIFSTYAPGDQLGFLNLGEELYEMFSTDEENGFTTVSFRIPTDYGIYGLGENFTTFNKRGKTLYTFPTDNYCLGASQVYKGIPFFLSNAGVGIVFPQYEPIKFDFGETVDGLILITVPSRSLTFYVLFGNPAEIISSFISMFRKPVMPPDWSFGLWWSRWAGIGPQSLGDFEKVVNRFRDEKIPLDVVVLDPQWIKDYVAGVTQATSFDWNRDKFKTDSEVGDFLESRGKKLALWINPYVAFYGTGYEKLRHCLLMTDKGKIAPVPAQDRNPDKPDRGMVDFDRQECSEIYSGLVTDLLRRSNARTVISDFGETVPPDAVDSHGNPGYMIRNRLGDLYQVAAYEGVRKARSDAMIWGRSGSLQSHNLPVKWGGDSNSTWEGMKTALRAALSSAMSGALFSAFDIGGFAGKPDKALFMRWSAAEALFSYFKLQGTTDREPWAYDDDAVSAFRELAEMRYSLLPYILAEARYSVEHFIPLSRPLVLAFPEDRNASCIDDEFMLGSSILVAPVLSEGMRRKIYLPEGNWVYFYDGTEYTGGRWIEKSEGFNRVPAFVLKGSVLEMTDGKSDSVEGYLSLPRVRKKFG